MHRQRIESGDSIVPEHHLRALGMTRDFTSLGRGGDVKVVERPHHGSINDDPSDRPPRTEPHRPQFPQFFVKSEVVEELAEIPLKTATHETLILDFSKGVDGAVKRQDAFELNFAPAAIPEEVVAHEKAERVRKRDRLYRIVSRGRDKAKAFFEAGNAGRRDNSSQPRWQGILFEA